MTKVVILFMEQIFYRKLQGIAHEAIVVKAPFALQPAFRFRGSNGSIRVGVELVRTLCSPQFKGMGRKISLMRRSAEPYRKESTGSFVHDASYLRGSCSACCKHPPPPQLLTEGHKKLSFFFPGPSLLTFLAAHSSGKKNDAQESVKI